MRKAASYFLLSLILASVGCTQEAEVTTYEAPCEGIVDEAERKSCYETHGVRLTVIHTSDIHSRLLPYDLDVLATDQRLGLFQENEPFGGIARAAYVIKRIRNNADHAIHVDAGDVFQGAPIFNEFKGDPEIQVLNEIGIDAYVLGNHEFDNGPINLHDKLSAIQFPVLAANYMWRPTQGLDEFPLHADIKPYTVINANGLRIGVIGLGCFSSMTSISYGDSGLGITVLEAAQVIQEYVDLLRPNVNVIMVLSHLGLSGDEDIIRRTHGIDLVFGGHLHVVLSPPKLVPDEEGRMVPLVHSGAFLKFVGRFDGVFTAHPEEPWNLELRTYDYEKIPIDSTLPEDPDMAHAIAEYEIELARRIDLRKVVGYTPEPLRRFGTSGGDSPLGNFLADTILMRNRVEADFAATNSLGIRADINRGEITIDQLYNVFPFPNTITTMSLSGNEVQELLDFNTYRSAGRGCATQLQVAGIEYDLDCDAVNKEVERTLDEGEIFEFEYRDGSVKFAKNIRVIKGQCHDVSDCLEGISICANNKAEICEIAEGDDPADCRCREEIQPEFFYKFATNNYMAKGGSGFRSLRFNTTQTDTGVDLRTAAVKAIEEAPTCLERCEEEMGASFDPERLGMCGTLQLCRDDITTYEARWCEGLDFFSDRDYCAEDAGAGHCLAAREMSDRELCYIREYRECDELFYLDKVEACYASMEASDGRCAEAESKTPKALCLEQHAPQCISGDLEGTSEYKDCLAFARNKAESLCPGLASPSAESEGRQRPIRPRNDAGASGGNPVAIMEALQASGEDAWYH